MTPDSKKLAVYHSPAEIIYDGVPGSRCVTMQHTIRVELFSYIILLITTLTLTGSANAKESNILILLSDNDDVYLDVATTIANSTIKTCRNQGLECQNAKYEINQVSSQPHAYSHEYRVIVTLGIKAAAYAKRNFNDIPLISALIPKDSKIHSDIGTDNPNHYYLYLNQPLHRSMLLIKVLSDSFKSIGAMISRNDKTAENALIRSAAGLDMTLNLEKIENKDQIGSSLNRLLTNSDILLAVPDSRIHNKLTVSNILISSYRKRIPLIGFSSAYVKAGALAAVYSSHEDIAFHVRDNIVRVFSGEKIVEKEQNAEYFSILFNSEVARSLDFPTKSVDELENIMIKRSTDGHD